IYQISIFDLTAWSTIVGKAGAMRKSSGADLDVGDIALSGRLTVSPRHQPSDQSSHQGKGFFAGCEAATSKATFGPWLHSSSGFSTETTSRPNVYRPTGAPGGGATRTVYCCVPSGEKLRSASPSTLSHEACPASEGASRALPRRAWPLRLETVKVVAPRP